MEANQGNPEALVKFINQIVSSEGITVADCTLKEGRLNLILEGLDIPSQERTVKLISKALKNFKLPDTTTVYIEGRKFGSNAPHWGHEVELTSLDDKNSEEKKARAKRIRERYQIQKQILARENSETLSCLGISLFFVICVILIFNISKEIFKEAEETTKEESCEDIRQRGLRYKRQGRNAEWFHTMEKYVDCSLNNRNR